MLAVKFDNLMTVQRARAGTASHQIVIVLTRG